MAGCTNSAITDLLSAMPLPIDDRVNVAESLVKELESRIAAILQGSPTSTPPDNAHTP